MRNILRISREARADQVLTSERLLEGCRLTSTSCIICSIVRDQTFIDYCNGDGGKSKRGFWAMSRVLLTLLTSWLLNNELIVTAECNN